MDANQVIDGIEKIRKLSGCDSALFVITAHPTKAKEISHSRLREACNEAGYKIAIRYNQEVGYDKLYIEAA